MSAKVLVVGSGGREHALAWGLQKSDDVEQIYVSPGNGGTEKLEKTTNVALKDSEIVNFCQENQVGLVVVGPEAPLVDGLADDLREHGISTFGASQEGAKLEGSKAFATKFMQENDVALPPSVIANSVDEALSAIEELGGFNEIVIKADGLAGGKGVFLPKSETEGRTALDDIFSGKVDKDGSAVVIQKRFHGPEVSIFVLSDGQNYKTIPLSVQDHKRLLEGDKGPNTGGMGVYAPLPEWMVNPDQWSKIDEIASKTISGMKNRGTPYQGVLYMGLMLAEETNGDPIMIEYNVRFGDPEAEVIVPLLDQSGVDVFEMLRVTAEEQLSEYSMPENLSGAAISVCLAAEGYPSSPKSGSEIKGSDIDSGDVVVFHGGTKWENEKLLSSGGRVLYVTAMANSLEEASSAAYKSIGENGVNFDGMQFRGDIGYRAIK